MRVQGAAMHACQPPKALVVLPATHHTKLTVKSTPTRAMQSTKPAGLKHALDPAVPHYFFARAGDDASPTNCFGIS